MTFEDVQNELIASFAQMRGATTLIKQHINRAVRELEAERDWPHMLSLYDSSVIEDQKVVVCAGFKSLVSFSVATKPVVQVTLRSLLAQDGTMDTIAVPLLCATAYDQTQMDVHYWPASAGAAAVAVYGHAFSSALTAAGDENWWTLKGDKLLLAQARYNVALFLKDTNTDMFLQELKEIQGGTADLTQS